MVSASSGLAVRLSLIANFLWAYQVFGSSGCIIWRRSIVLMHLSINQTPINEDVGFHPKALASV